MIIDLTAAAGGLTELAINHVSFHELLDPTGTASAVVNGLTVATLYGVVSPSGSGTSAYFRYTTDPTFATFTTTPTQVLARGTAAVTVQQGLSGLTPGATYYYQLVAVNNGGSFFGAIQSFVAGGRLDSTFSSDGIQTTLIGPGNDRANGIAIQSDGKIVVVGESHNGSNDDFAVARYLADGTLDTTFGGLGQVTTSFGSGNDGAGAVAVQSDGKIVVAGATSNGTHLVFATLRYHADGSLDTSFNGGGVATAFGGADAVANSVAVQADGKIVVAGEAIIGSTYDFAVARYNANGSLDTSFDGDGKRTTPIGAGYDYAESVAIQSDGKIVVAGHSHSGVTMDFAVVRYYPDGNLDLGFDGDGKATTDFFGIGDDIGTSMALQRDGKILVAGNAFNGSFNDMGVVRYNADGSRDMSFGSDGKATVAVSSTHEGAYSVAVQSDGRIVLAGGAYNGTDFDFALARLNPDGILDTTFDGDGKVTIALGASNESATAMALQSDGKIVAAGYSNNGSNNDFAVVRLLGGPNDLLVNGAFESAESLGGGMPVVFGDWRNDQASTVTAENGITPYAGSRMLKFLGTAASGGSTDNGCSVVQFVPMTAYAAQIAAGNLVRVHVSGRFNRIEATDSEFDLELLGYNGTPSNPGTVTTARGASFISDGNVATWELNTNYIDLPPGTTMVAVYVVARENLTNNPSSPEFDGNYADDVQLTVQTDFTPPVLTMPASPLLEGVTSPAGAIVNFTVSALDAVDGPVTATAVPASGSTFPIGDMTVNVTATDAAGNVATGSFLVRVGGSLSFWFVQVYQDTGNYPSVATSRLRMR